MHLSWQCLFAAVLLAFAGCATPDQLRPIPILDGRVVDIPFGPGGPRPGQGNGYLVVHAALAPGAEESEVLYEFAVVFPVAITPRSIRVEDISDEKPYLLIDDEHPWQTNRIWTIKSLPLKAGDPRLAWVYNVSPSMRVYRFTILDGTDRRTVLYQVVNYPNFLKVIIRKKWGEKY